MTRVLLPLAAALLSAACTTPGPRAVTRADWTSDHVMIGVRWQPSVDMRGAEAQAQADYAVRENPAVRISDFVYIWCFWETVERPGVGRIPQSNVYWDGMLANIKRAHDAGLKVHLVLAFTPTWAFYGEDTNNLKTAAQYMAEHDHTPHHNQVPRDPGYFADFCRRLATEVVDLVGGYDLWHESNLDGHWRYKFSGGRTNQVESDFAEQMECMRLGAEAIREVYAKAGRHVELSYSGTSPCGGCTSVPGLATQAADRVRSFYDQIIANPPLLKVIDNVALNVSDVGNGFGSIDPGESIGSAWNQFLIMRRKLDAAGLQGKGITAGESWIGWDDGPGGIDLNGDGMKNEVDAAFKTIRGLGNMMHYGLNEMNLPWEDNSSGWAMGLTKQRDLTGLLAQKGLRTVPNTFGPYADPAHPIVFDKYQPGTFTVLKNWDGAYAQTNDPVHLHFYFFNWFARLSAGRDEAVRHALSPEVEPRKKNRLVVIGTARPDADASYLPGVSPTNHEVLCASSWNRTRQEFVVLVYSPGETGTGTITVRLPSTIQTGTWYNNRHSELDFRGEGIPAGKPFIARWETKNISYANGQDEHSATGTAGGRTTAGAITVEVPAARKFTTVWIRAADAAP
jgi:hypothetical protein